MYRRAQRTLSDGRWMGRKVLAGSNMLNWCLKDSYVFISAYCTISAHTHKLQQLDSARPISIRSYAPLPRRASDPQLVQPQRRNFHDYFTTVIPAHNSASDPPPFPGKESSAASSTIVRIPLKFAKQHFGQVRSRGNRPYNEDWAQAGVLDLPVATLLPSALGSSAELKQPGLFTQSPTSSSTVFYYAVFDGHGGEDCSKFLKTNLHEYIEKAARDFYPSDPLSSSKQVEQTSLGDEIEDQISQKQHRKRLQAKLITEWKETVGGYFRRFKPDFTGPDKSRTEESSAHDGSSTDITNSATGDGSWESILTYAFLRADLDFITGRWNRAALAATEGGIGPVRDGSAVEDPTPSKGKTAVKSGSTASVAMIFTHPSSGAPYWSPTSTSTLLIAHIGDTRVLLSSTITGLAKPLTSTHHPSHPQESRRLRRYTAAFISDSFGEERFGVLANTRSFGDAGQKRLGITAEPEVTRHEIKGTDWSFLVLCSDGITGVLSDQEIVDIVKEANTPEEGAKEVVKFAEEVAGRSISGGDNATCMVVRLGGWEKRQFGGEGSEGSRELRRWKLEQNTRRQ